MLKVFLSNRISQISSELSKLHQYSEETSESEKSEENTTIVEDCIEKTFRKNSNSVSSHEQQPEVINNGKDIGIQTSCQTEDSACQTKQSLDELKMSNPYLRSNPITERKLEMQKSIDQVDSYVSSRVEEYASLLHLKGKPYSMKNGTMGSPSPTHEENNRDSPVKPEAPTKRSSEIFSGFNSTLNRIEDMVKTERKPRPSYTSSLSRTDDGFRSGSSLGSRIDDNFRSGSSLGYHHDDASYRSSSSLGFRADDSYRSSSSLSSRFDDTLSSPKYSSPYTTSFSSGNTRSSGGSTEGFESKYQTRSYASPLFSSSKYDLSRTYGGSNSARDSTSNSYSPRDISAKSTGGVMSDLSREKDEKIRELATKVQELENSLKTVQKENEEYVQLVQELSSVPGNEQVQQIIKRKISIPGFQPTDKAATARKENIQVAHIRPFSSDDTGSNARIDNAYKDRKISLNDQRSPNDLIEFSPDFERQASSRSSRNSIGESASSDAAEKLKKRDNESKIINTNTQNTGNRLAQNDTIGTTNLDEPTVIFSSEKSSQLSLPNLPIG